MKEDWFFVNLLKKILFLLTLKKIHSISVKF